MIFYYNYLTIKNEAIPPTKNAEVKLPAQIKAASSGFLSLKRTIIEAIQGTNKVITIRATTV